MVSVLLGGLIGAFAPQGVFTRTAFLSSYGGSYVCLDKDGCMYGNCRQTTNMDGVTTRSCNYSVIRSVWLSE